ncbi:terpene cyclase/mutase family protein [Streptomyces sp. ISL-43]|uniref:prenyltransferase/squalene oxidase repeat-containing protein n=1 Tax=Streptomyces sp. ISL-43 TaxID=2819183 RepID=UPI001BE664DB|nr:prenyltransferase/squalene oxidase repeat-containing protein [Streptomyces sp. ISL-43]MBT2449955.1 terpene cyclase/mutase family protein [Streptomyces sp. ISL-43]
MNVRRSAATLAASAVLCVGAAPAAFADVASPSPAPAVPSGLFGKNDPTYDGVWRQSFALLGQHTAGVKPAPQAVDWLVGQQCADGSFASFRADAAAACDAKTMLDTNAAAVAVQALKTLGGHDAAVKKGADWLKSVQNEDGGWAYVPGSPSEASSTAVVISALAVAGEKPADVKSKAGKSAYEGLLAFQLGCSAEPAADRGAFAYQPTADGKLPANADATAAAVLAGLATGPLLAPSSTDTPAAALACPATAGDPAAAAQGAAGYLAQALRKDGHLTALTPGADQPTPDIGNTADAVIALAAAGHKQSATGALEWLKSHSAEWAKDSPAGLGTLILAAHATGTDPKSFGGTDLVAALNATGPAAEKEKDKEKGNKNVWWMIGAGAAAGAGIGIVLSGRRKKNQL